MNLFVLSWQYIRAKPLNTALNVLLLAFGIAIIVVLLSLSRQVQDKLTNNSRGIDLVVGAKGSPLQLMLASVFHIDYPTGNIPLAEAKKISRNRYIKNAIPLALGDSYRSFRIVGTNHDYTDLYGASVEEGTLWVEDFETTLGATVARELNLHPGDDFFGQHGMADAGQTHEEQPYRVVGILEKSNTVVDNLILTNIESIWGMHAHEEEHESAEHPEGEEAPHAGNEKIAVPVAKPDQKPLPSNRRATANFPQGSDAQEITSLLIQYNSPMGTVTMPRYVNSQSNLQAASPAFEMVRLFSLLGVGVNLLQGFAYLIILISGLSIFVALYNTLKERKYDLAIMRSLGSSPAKLFVHVVLEGIIITIIGGLLGFLLGHGAIEVLSLTYEKSGDAGISGSVFFRDELYILLLCLGLGLVASLIPAIQAYRIDISKVLAEGS